jgi:hypothetical protein
MPDIFLYAGESIPSDIMLSDPTVVRSGGSYYGILKRWTGATWVKEPLKYWNGSIWATKPLKVWDGATWQLIDITG